MWQHGQQVQLETAMGTVLGIYWVYDLDKRAVLLGHEVSHARQVTWAVCLSEKKPVISYFIIRNNRVTSALSWVKFDQIMLAFGTEFSEWEDYVKFLAYRQTRDAALEFLLLCKHQLIPIHRDIARVIARIVYDSYAESIWIK